MCKVVGATEINSSWFLAWKNLISCGWKDKPEKEVHNNSASTCQGLGDQATEALAETNFEVSFGPYLDPNCHFLGINLSGPQFLYLQNGVNNMPLTQSVAP